MNRKSTSGTCQFLGTSLVSWSSRKQASVALSSTEAEYVAAASCCSQILWMKQTLKDFGLSYGRVPIYIDNMSTISLAKNPVMHSRTKHIDIRFHFLRDSYEKREIEHPCAHSAANYRYPNQAPRANHVCSLARRVRSMLSILRCLLIFLYSSRFSFAFFLLFRFW